MEVSKEQMLRLATKVPRQIKDTPGRKSQFSAQIYMANIANKSLVFHVALFQNPRGNSVVSTPKKQNISFPSEISYVLCINLRTSKWLQ